MFHTLSNGSCESDLIDTHLHISMSFTKENIIICCDFLSYVTCMLTLSFLLLVVSNPYLQSCVHQRSTDES